jgi:hypothetical protein
MSTQSHAIIGENIEVTDHAADEAVKDFGVDRHKAKRWIADKLRKATFIGNTIGVCGTPSRLFGYRRMSIVVDAKEDRVITVYPQDQADSEMRAEVERIVLRKVRAKEKEAAKQIKEIERQKADYMVEAAQAYRKLVDAKTKAAKAKLQAQIDSIDEEITKLNEMIFEIKQDAARVAKSAVAFFV